MSATQAPAHISPSEVSVDAGRLKEASVISEADIRAENPVIIGLISMLTGIIDLEQIEQTHRQLWLRGRRRPPAQSKTCNSSSMLGELRNDVYRSE